MVDEFIAVSLPFGLSIVLQLLNSGVRAYAKRSARFTIPKTINVTESIENLCVDLAVHTYLHLSFIFGVIMSSVSCIAYTVLSARPLIAAIGAVALIVLIPTWLIRWQGLSASQLEGKEGKPMKRAAWWTIVFLWLLTVYARFYPVA